MATEKSHEHKRKESDPPSYQADLMEKESVASRIWKRRIAIIYVLLLLAVSATAIYFAIASARLEGELKLKGTKEVHPTEPTGSLQLRNKNDDEESDNDVQGELLLEKEDDDKEPRELSAVPHRMLRNGPNKDDQIVEIMKKFLDVAQTAAKDCIFHKHKSEEISFSERKDLKIIHTHILPIASRLGIPETAKAFNSKYSLVLKQLECLMRSTLLANDIEPLLIKIAELMPNQDSDGDIVSILPYDDLTPDPSGGNGYSDNGYDSNDELPFGPVPTVLINLPTFSNDFDANEIHDDQNNQPMFSQPLADGINGPWPTANGIDTEDFVPLAMPFDSDMSFDSHIAMPMASPVAMPMENHIAMPMENHIAMPMESPVAMPMASPVAMPVEYPPAMPTPSRHELPMLVPMIAPDFAADVNPIEDPTVEPMTTTTESPPNDQSQPSNMLNKLNRNGQRRKGAGGMRPWKNIGMNSRALS